tara:strand:+ start:62 stop:418 length:357 start_codon:yes stop_codon:yes gene_type:complete
MFIKKVIPYIVSDVFMAILIITIEHFSENNPNPLNLVVPLITSSCAEYISNKKFLPSFKYVGQTYFCMLAPFGGAFVGAPNQQITTYIILVGIAAIGGLFYGSLIEALILISQNSSEL